MSNSETTNTYKQFSHQILHSFTPTHIPDYEDIFIDLIKSQDGLTLEDKIRNCSFINSKATKNNLIWIRGDSIEYVLKKKNKSNIGYSYIGGINKTDKLDINEVENNGLLINENIMNHIELYHVFNDSICDVHPLKDMTAQDIFRFDVTQTSDIRIIDSEEFKVTWSMNTTKELKRYMKFLDLMPELDFNYPDVKAFMWNDLIILTDNNKEKFVGGILRDDLIIDRNFRGQGVGTALVSLKLQNPALAFFRPDMFSENGYKTVCKAFFELTNKDLTKEAFKELSPARHNPLCSEPGRALSL